MADGGVGRMAAPIARPFIGRDPRATSRDLLRDQLRAGGPVRMATAPEAGLARVPRYYMRGRRSLAEGPPSPFIGMPTGRIGGGRIRRACLPPRVGTGRRPRARCLSCPRSGRYRAGWPGCAAIGFGAVRVRSPARVRGRPWACLWPFRAAAPAWPSLFEDGSRQQDIVALTDPTALGRKVALIADRAPFGLPTVWPCQPLQVEMAFQPEGAELSSRSAAIGMLLMLL